MDNMIVLLCWWQNLII